MKSIVDFARLSNDMVGITVPKPLSGTLSGHAAGEPFDKKVYSILKSTYKDRIFRQYEYLNFLYSKNLNAAGLEAKQKLFSSPTVLFLLSRSDSATQRWSLENPFEEKQNDTADILAVEGNTFELIDVKTRNISKSAQPPNIISSYKLAQLCAKMLDNNDFDSFTIDYFEVDWKLEDKSLVSTSTHHANLFKAVPDTLYINWAAAMQIQFHVADCNQSYTENKELWAKSYLKHFVSEAKIRAAYMIDKFVKPFEKYI